MIRGRVDHTATLLRDGRVLVVGGLGTGGPLQVEHSAELYDPATGSWSGTGRVNDPFVDHTATLLRDGSVLVAGGGSAQLYDPASGTWRATGKMIEQRYFHTATLLPDGRVLVAGGGCCVADRSLVSAEIYDPGTGTWSAAGRMIESRMYHKAMLLSDGNVLITGGSDGSKSGTPPIPLASPELYDPIRGTWTATGEMRAVRCCLPTFTLLADGTVLAAGGIGQSGGLLASAELYDSSSGTWTATVNMHEARAGQTATLLLNGTVLVAGGDNGLVDSSGNPPIPVTSAELYDPGSGT
jgi:N-acetylneuraminic acid mutarotase